jgi:hypothetical protein
MHTLTEDDGNEIFVYQYIFVCVLSKNPFLISPCKQTGFKLNTLYNSLLQKVPTDILETLHEALGLRGAVWGMLVHVMSMNV